MSNLLPTFAAALMLCLSVAGDPLPPAPAALHPAAAGGTQPAPPRVAPAVTGTPNAAPAPELRRPRSLHLSAYSTPLAAKLSADGSFDTGGLSLQFVDGETGAPLDTTLLRYERGPHFSSYFYHEFGGVTGVVRAVAFDGKSGDDARVRLAVKLGLENPTTEERSVHVRALVRPGSGAAETRPYPAWEFAPDDEYGQDGEFVTRNGHAVMWMGGVKPEIELRERVAGADEPFCVLDWKISVPPDRAESATVHLGGPPAGEGLDEAGWRAAFRRHSFEATIEMSRWQSDVRPTYTRCNVGDKRLSNLIVAGIQTLRLYGDGNRMIRRLTDRPFNHPATDIAVEAEMVATFTEFGLTAFAVDRLDPLISDPPAEVADLSPERRLAYVWNLARAARLAKDDLREGMLALLIVELCEEGAAVPAYADPELVRADLSDILGRVGMDDEAEALPAFHWGEFPEGSTEALTQSVRRALSEGRSLDAWAHLGRLLDRTSLDGFGGMDPEGDFDGRFPIHTLALFREFIIDDHGDDMHVFPGLVAPLLPDFQRMRIRSLPSVFGGWTGTIFWTFKKRHRLGADFKLSLGARRPRDVILYPPAPHKARAISIARHGEVELQPDGTMKLVLTGLGVELNAVLSAGDS